MAPSLATVDGGERRSHNTGDRSKEENPWDHPPMRWVLCVWLWWLHGSTRGRASALVWKGPAHLDLRRGIWRRFLVANAGDRWGHASRRNVGLVPGRRPI